MAMQSWMASFSLPVDLRTPLTDRYDPLLSDKESLTDSDDAVDNRLVRLDALYRTYRRRPNVATAVLFLSVAVCVLVFISRITYQPSEQECVARTSIWSPVNDIVKYETFDFQNEFDHQTIYRGPPTPKLEQAWDSLWYFGGARIPDDKVSELNRTLHLGGQAKLTPVNDGGGGVQSMLEVFHQLHCLNMIRQYTWRDWYPRHKDIVQTPADLLDSRVGSRMHVDHCIEALRLTLMCHADTTPMLMISDSDLPTGGRADFNVHHKCRNFDDIQQWSRENELVPPPPVHWEPDWKSKGDGSER